MTISTTIAFIIVCFMFLCVFIRLISVVWGAIVYQQDVRDGRDYWDADEETEVRKITLEEMGTHTTPIEIIPAEVRSEP